MADQRRADGAGKLGVRVPVHRQAEVTLQHRANVIAQRLTPPVNSNGPCADKRPIKFALRRAMALITPARIASGATPAERRLITSDSANTVHMLVMACASTPSVMASSCSTLAPRVREITFQKATGAGRAFVIHQKVAEVALRIQLDDFAVLAADINHRAGFRRQQTCAEPVTGNLRHLFIGKIDQLATIAGEG